MNFIKSCHFKITSRIFNPEAVSSQNVSHVRFLSDDKDSCDGSNDEKSNKDAVCNKDCEEPKPDCETEVKCDCEEPKPDCEAEVKCDCEESKPDCEAEVKCDGEEKKTNPCENAEDLTDPVELERLERGLEYLNTPIPGMLSDVTSRGHDYTSEECYQAPEYYMYHKYSFYDAQNHLSSKRLPQPMQTEDCRASETN